MFYKPINVLYMKKLILTLLGILILSAFSAFATDVTISQSTFSATSGNIDGDPNISYTTAKNDGTTNPAIVSNQLRLYKPSSGKTIGGSITITANNGCNIKSLSVSNGNKNTTVKYQVDNESEVTGKALNKNATLSIPGINAHSVTITNTGTEALGINNITVTYSTGGTTEPTITLAFAETEGSINIGETKNLPALNATVSDNSTPQLTYTYSSNNTEVATVDENGVITGVAAGTAKITASCVAEGFIVKDAVYTVTVFDPNNVSIEITAASFNYTTESYAGKTFTDAKTEVGYSAFYTPQGNNYIQFNKTSSRKACGLNVITTSNLYAISSIYIEFVSGQANKGLDVYASDNAFNELSTASITPSTSGTQVASAITTSQTIAINAKAFAIYPAGTGLLQIAKVTVNYKKIDTSKTTPKLSFAETEVVEEFVEGKTLAVQVPTSDTDGLSYTYKSSDPAVATVDGETITLVGTGSTTITVTSAETETLNSATASYTLVSEMVYHSIADLLKYAKNGETVDIAFPMTVGHVGPQGKNFYVTDGEGYMLIYNSKGITMPAYENLDVIPAGWTATCTIYNGLPELVPVTAPAAATEKGTYAIETIDATNWAAQPLNKIVKVNNVVFDAATPGENASTAERNFTGKVGDTVIKFFNNFKLAAEDAGTYNVTAITSFFVNRQTTVGTETNQLAPIAYSAQPTEAVITPTPENDEIKVKAGDIITFTFANASKLEVVIETEEAPETQGAPVLKAAAEPIPVEGDTYKYTVPAQVLNTIITVTPYNAEGEKLADRAASVMLVNADTTGVIDVTVAGEGEIEYFNLQGVRIANPESGLYIRRQGKQVSKVYLR